MSKKKNQFIDHSTAPKSVSHYHTEQPKKVHVKGTKEKEKGKKVRGEGWKQDVSGQKYSLLSAYV
jgi:hypothetical protein